MSEFRGKLSTVKRPKILVKAAKIASRTYIRSRDLSAILGYSHPVTDTLIAKQLFDLEHFTNQERRQGDASYDLKKHVQILSALLSEVQVEPERANQIKLSGTEAFFCTT